MSKTELLDALLIDLAVDDCWVSVFDAAHSVDVAKKLFMMRLRSGDWTDATEGKFQEYVKALHELSEEIDSVEWRLNNIRREIKEAK